MTVKIWNMPMVLSLKYSEQLQAPAQLKWMNTCNELPQDFTESAFVEPEASQVM